MTLRSVSRRPAHLFEVLDAAQDLKYSEKILSARPQMGG